MDAPGLEDDFASAIAAVDFEPVQANDADAADDAQVYSKPVIEVEVPGLDETRSLQRDSIIKKLGELQERGLASADIAGL